jgi:pimeloyl-ACP methyl ester carboxylesterase
MSTSFTHTVGERTYSGLTNIDGGFERADGVPLVIALHGGTYTSKYFDIQGYSLLDRAGAQGIPVIAVDRPNYGGSSPLGDEDSIILANAVVLEEAIGSIWSGYGAGATGVVLIGHSIGGAVATAIAAAAPSWPLLGLAISGCLVHIPVGSRAIWEGLPLIPMIDLASPAKDAFMFGPAGTYPRDMPEASYPSNTLVPRSELIDATGGWIERRAEMCGRVKVPVHHRQGEFDALWISTQAEVDEFRAGFTSALSIDTELQMGSGHCIDFHHASEQFQSGQLAFARACARAS